MKQGKISVATVSVALVGVLLCGMGVAFNNCAGLGNDSVGIFYDGIRSFLGLTGEQLGMASHWFFLLCFHVVVPYSKKKEKEKIKQPKTIIMTFITLVTNTNLLWFKEVDR